MEYRMWITVPDLPFEPEERWEPFGRDLDKRHAELGPILSWDGSNAVVILLVDSESEATAAQVAFDAVSDSLRQTGLADHYPAHVEVEHVDEPEVIVA